MKQFKPSFRRISMAAMGLLIATACSNDIDDIAQQPQKAEGIPFTATITTGGSQTRALSDPDGENKIQSTWATGEHVALVYKVGDETKVTDAEVTAVDNGSGQMKATITAALDEHVTSGTDVTLIYPFSAVNQTEGDDYGKIKSDVFEGQTGELTPRATPDDTSISEKYDLRQGAGKITIITDPVTSTSSASLKKNVTMASQIAIWKLTLKKSDNSDLSVTKFFVYFGGMTASATVTGGTSELYMAVPAGSTSLTFIATAADGSYMYNKTSVTLSASTYYQSTVTLTKQTAKTITIETRELTLSDGDIVSGTGYTNTQLKIAAGATVTLAGLTNNLINGDGKIAGIECLGDATIILADGSENTLKGHDKPAIQFPANHTLTIAGSGTLTASSDYGSGIGSPQDGSCGDIIINGGTVTATGVGVGAGIGSGERGSCGNITINGGTVTAKGDNNSGIGSGQQGSCGNITIRGGTVKAKGDNGAGIGSASGNNSQCGNIIISGGTVTAESLDTGIGSGERGSCGTITISGGTVKTKGGNGAGIGSGQQGSCGTITISGGTINAEGYGAGIGSGQRGSCGTITISGGAVNAKGNVGAGIGSGQYGSCDGVTIYDTVTKVTAKSSFESWSIGKGQYGTCGTVTIGGTEYWGEDPDNPGTYIYKNNGEPYLTQVEIVYPNP